MACILQAMLKISKAFTTPFAKGFTTRFPMLLAIMAVCLLQACSAIKLAYNNASEFGYWWLDGYVDFTESQTLKVRAELARLQQWHRSDELPKIADLLQKAQRLAETDMGAGPVCALFA